MNNLFPFAIDTSVRYNLAHACFLEFYDDSAGISAEEAKAVNDRYYEIAAETGNFLHTDSPRPISHGVYETLGFKQIKCKDGKKRRARKIRLNFVVEGQTFSDIFYVDKSLCSYTKGKYQIQGILGLDFMVEHKWVIDFAELKICGTSE